MNALRVKKKMTSHHLNAYIEKLTINKYIFAVFGVIKRGCLQPLYICIHLSSILSFKLIELVFYQHLDEKHLVFTVEGKFKVFLSFFFIFVNEEILCHKKLGLLEDGSP